MPFHLTIAEGKEAGRQFVFEQPQVVIGREAECDVVLYDPGVSRKHARIFAEGNVYFVEDMGSSNGTKVNGSVVKKQKLSNGDAVALGPVVFNFNANNKADGTDPSAASMVDEHTRVFSATEQKARQSTRSAALIPDGAGDDELNQIQRSATRSMQPLRPRNGNTGPGNGASPSPAPLARSSGAAISSPRANASSPAAVSTSGARGGLSAAERARIRRESPGALGRLKLFWIDATTRVRVALSAALAAVVLGCVAGLFYVVLGDNGAPKKVIPPEPNELTRKPIEASFGLGDGVTYARPDMKVFSFQFISATSAVVILHFQAVDISDGEVVVTVNGADVGKVPADSLNSAEISHEIVVPPPVLKKGQKNEVIFDNVRNPPGTETWRIWNIWVEVVPLPEESTEDLVRDAQSSYQNAELKLERREVGAVNRYEAWKGFRDAWLKLESHPDPKPELYQMARTKMHETQKELDAKCSQLMLEAQSAFNHNDWKAASGTLDHVKDFFPTNDQPCLLRAEQLRFKMGL